jgi:hypothetical protein
MSSPWWAFDKDDDDLHDPTAEHEKAALDAIHALERLADKQPEHALRAGQAMRKVWAVAQAKSQSLSLRTMTVKRGDRA